MAALLTDLLKPIREAAEHRDRAVQKSAKADAERIHGVAERLESDAAPAYAVFASDLDGIFELEALTHPVRNVSALGPRPYLRPLRAAPRTFRAGVLVADRTLARVFVVSGDLVDEIGEPFRADIGKPNYGGFAGYDEHVVRARADVTSARMWRDAGQVLLERHQRQPFDYLAIGGHDETIDEIARTLHPYLDRLHRVAFVVNPNTLSLASIRAQLAEQAEAVRRQRDAEMASRVCDIALSDGLAVLGLTPTLAGCTAQAVDTLVVAGEFTLPGVICNSCGFLSRTGEICPVCGATMFDVDDVVAAAMESAISAGGNVHQVAVASQLDSHGVGALTRFPFQG
ncbi:MAG: hypothetical protein ACRDZM_04775 [Acidimicrobiia bacterium]